MYVFSVCTCTYIYAYLLLLLCSNQTIGGWSSEGIIQDSDPNLPVLCNTTHLTSFSILVSPKLGKSSQVFICTCICL